MTPITWNATDISPGVRDFRIKWVNTPYLRNNNIEWSPLNGSFVEDGNFWQTVNSPVRIRAPKLATQPISLVNGVSYDVFSKRAINAPEQELIITHPNIRPVDGRVVEGREFQVIYPNAIMDGVDLAVGVWHGRAPRAEHLYVIRSMPPGNGPIEIESEITAVGSKIDKWDRVSELDAATDKVSILLNQDERRGWSLKKPVAWYYENGKIVKTPINAKIRLQKTGTVLIRKIIPRTLVRAALDAGSELRCDLTGTFYPDANPETTTTDGVLYKNYMSEGSWASLIDASSSLVSADEPVDNPVYIQCSGGNQYKGMARGIFLFDTSSLESSSVSSAVMSFYCHSKQVSGTFSPGFNVYGCTTSSNTGLTGTDYASTQGTAFSTTIENASFATSAYNTFTLNGSGLAAINQTGISKFAVRETYYDVARNTPPNVNGAYFITYCYMADNSGTSEDPKLVVTYTAGGSIAVLANHYRKLIV